MTRSYRIDGQEVGASWSRTELPRVYKISVAAIVATNTVEKTSSGKFIVRDGQGRLLGTYAGLWEAVEHVVRVEQR